ncbi:MAG: SoxR reducing system RseC family protein [Gammaproteobacteria bacterium]|nr:SoxR reducing system RseC family protein [Gammaproteobacteria bacterium]
MIEHQGVVVAREGARVWVEFQRQTSCGQCAVNGSCGTGVIGKVLGRRINRMVINSTLDTQVGEQVVVGIKEDTLLTSAMVAYGVPLIGLLSAPLLLTLVAAPVHELWSALAILFGGGLGVLGARQWSLWRGGTINAEAQLLRRTLIPGEALLVRRVDRHEAHNE